MFTKITNSGSRNSTPGNICVDSTAPLNRPRPRKVYRERAYEAKIAMITLNAVAQTLTIRLFAK